MNKNNQVNVGVLESALRDRGVRKYAGTLRAAAKAFAAAAEIKTAERRCVPVVNKTELADIVDTATRGYHGEYTSIELLMEALADKVIDLGKEHASLAGIEKFLSDIDRLNAAAEVNKHGKPLGDNDA